MIIAIDTETTGLLQPEGTPMEIQPYITEICAIKMDESMNEVANVTTLIKPPIPIPEEITKITGINDRMVAKAPPFANIYRSLAGLFLGAHTLLAHNASFDVGMLALELKRLDKLLQFPWPPIHYCTVERSMHLKGHRLKLQELHQMATGKPEVEGAHRAEKDVRGLIECYKWLKEK